MNSSQKQLLLNHSAFGRKRPTVTSLQASENGTLPARLSRKGRIEASFSTMSLPITVKAAVSPDDVLWENLGKFNPRPVCSLLIRTSSSRLRFKPHPLFVRYQKKRGFFRWAGIQNHWHGQISTASTLDRVLTAFRIATRANQYILRID